MQELSLVFRTFVLDLFPISGKETGIYGGAQCSKS